MPGLLQVGHGTGNHLSQMMSMREINERYFKAKFGVVFLGFF